jgi:hypothetical protein
MFGTGHDFFISKGISFAEGVGFADATIEAVFTAYIGYFYKASEVDFRAYSLQFEIGRPFVKVTDNLRLLAEE